MKTDLAEILRGKTLKSQIYRTITGSKFGNMGHLLKNNKKNDVKYMEFRSQETQAESHRGDNKLKTDRSLKKIGQSSSNMSLENHKQDHSEENHLKNQRTQKRSKAVSESEQKRKKRDYLLTNSKKSSKQKSSPKKPQSKTVQILINKTILKGKRKEKGNFGSKQQKKLSNNLESILQISSSQQLLITPAARSQQKRQQKEYMSSQKTKKKHKNEIFSSQIRKRIQKSFTEPERFIKLLKNDLITVNYRILKKRLIQIEVYVLKPIESLTVNLNKGYLQCQNIQEVYNHITSNTLISLFSSVRNLNINDLFDLPSLNLKIDLGNEGLNTERCLTLPYTWLHYIDEQDNIFHKKSRIKTKLCLQNLPIHPKKLKILSLIFKTWIKRSFKGQQEFQTHFSYNNESEYQLKLIEEKQTFTLQLEGRGQQRLTKMIEFFSQLIC